MTVKELSRLYHLNKEIDRLNDNLEKLKEKAKVNKEIIAKRNDWEKATERFVKIYKKVMEMGEKR